jgi:ribosomal protein S18 acetylase RimI-like enzyme
LLPFERRAYAVNMQSIQIRAAAPENADAVASLLKTAFEEFKHLYTPRGFEATTPPPDQIRKRLDEGPVWIAVQDEVIVGTVSGIAMNELFYIRGMGVDPAARKLGVGQALLQHAENYAIQNGFKAIWLSTTPFLAGAIRLYQLSGFYFTGENDDLFGTPLLKMIKRIR